MIRPARKDEATILTQISFESKGYWDYPAEYFEIWKDELTISEDYIARNRVFVFEQNCGVVGYYATVELREDLVISGITLPKGHWLEHMFIRPQHICNAIGSRMFRHLDDWCRSAAIRHIGILADPHSRGFYEKMGCRYIKEYSSTIKNRTTPYLIFTVHPHANQG